jgi:hypothetical protein
MAQTGRASEDSKESISNIGLRPLFILFIFPPYFPYFLLGSREVNLGPPA